MFHSGTFTISGVQQQFNALGRWTGQVNNITITPGDRIYIGSPGSGGCSVGFRATNGRNGFVTAAHCGRNVANNYRVYNRMGERIGTLASNQRFLENIDAAFVEINNNVTISTFLPPLTYLTATAANPVIGQWIMTRGGTSGHRGGFVTRVNFNRDIRLSSGNYLFVLNTTESDFGSWPGDSGGVAFSYSNLFDHNIQGIAIAGTPNMSVISRTSEITIRTGWRLN